MKVLMFGWEFPPFSHGGLGTACHGLTKGLSKQDIDVTFVIPRASSQQASSHVNLISADDVKNITIKVIDSPLTAYMGEKDYNEFYNSILSLGRSKDGVSIYGRNLFAEVERYAQQAALIAGSIDHDIIHAHDWMTFHAGILAKQISGKPLVVHVHATEFDRTGGNSVHQFVYDREREGMHAADKVIAVSNFTKQRIVEHYGVPPEKVEVVHNAVDFDEADFISENRALKADSPVVLFLGRVTVQKGPDWFLQAARKVLDVRPDVNFVMAGSGDMLPRLIRQSAELGISDRTFFTGYLRGKDVDAAYQMADLYVMPSVSEPFGITPLESLRNNVPVLISKQSGVSEVLENCLKVDFWDIDEMADKILAVVDHPVLHTSLRNNGSSEVRRFSWDTAAGKCIGVYNQCLSQAS